MNPEIISTSDPDYLTHLFSTYLQTRWSDNVRPLLEDKGRLIRLREGPFMVLAQTGPIKT